MTSVHHWTVVGLSTLQIMFDFIDCSLFIVCLYDTCLIRPQKIIFKNGIKSNKIYEMRERNKKMREFKEKNKQ